MRTVRLLFTQEDRDDLCRQCTGEEVVRAIHYLSTWAMDSAEYATCNIYISVDESEIGAVYRKDNGDGTQSTTYTLHGIWHDTHFGFHS